MSDLPSINGLPQIGGRDTPAHGIANGVRRICATVPSTIRYEDEDSANNYRINAARAALAYLRGWVESAAMCECHLNAGSLVESLAEIDALLRGAYDQRDTE